ncbi:MAG: gamma-glutamyl-gamma-aminobutyrate hydrolase family protein [Candidatus Limiplasma sp.]|nr:gamma-glutamyl-gamma-aminobutyrate hydrolase family protein [Candidatus Limiplasma sp.]
MERMPIIGVTGSIEDDEHRQFINSNYLARLLKAGMIPLVLSLDMDSHQIPLCLDRLDGLLLSGGNDVDPMMFGEAPTTGLGAVSPKRDKLEMHVVKEAYRRNMPIFAICRGIQSLNVALGGTLYQDLPSQYRAADDHPPLLHAQTAHERYPSHKITVTPGTPLYEIFQEDSLAVNSFHHQAIKALAPPLTVCARATDGVIEAVYDTEKPFVLGVQWHPERMKEGMPLFHAFEKACAAYAAAHGCLAVHG